MIPSKRRRYPADEIVRLLQQHLVDGVPVPQICAQHGVHPTIFYRWQRELFRRAQTAFEPRFTAHRVRSYQEKLRQMRILLRDKQRELSVLQRKTESSLPRWDM